MKKLSYFIVLLASIFSLNMLVSAETCTYSAVLPYDSLNAMHGVFTAHGSSNSYLYLRAIASKEKINIDGNDFNNFYQYSYDLDKAIVTTKTGSYEQNDNVDYFSISIETGSDKFDISYLINKWGKYWAGPFYYLNKSQATPMNYSTKNNGGKSGEMNQSFNECPTAVSIRFTGNQKDMPDFTFNKGFYLEDYNFDYLKMIDDANFSSDGSFNIIGFLDNTTTKVNNSARQDNAKLLKAVSCSVDFQRYGPGGVTDEMADVISIIDNASVGEYNIRNIYADMGDMSDEEVEKVISKIKNDEPMDSITQKKIQNYIFVLPYLQEATAEEAIAYIKSDREKLENYINNNINFETCIKNAYNVDSNIEAVKKYMEYDSLYQGLYAGPMKELLDIFTDENIKLWYEAQKEIDYVNSKRQEDKCSEDKIPNTAARRECLKSQINNDINSINCPDLIGKTTLTPTEQVLQNALDKICSNPADYNCYLTNCHRIKNGTDVTREIEKLIDGETEAQEQIKANIDEFYGNMVQHAGFEIDDVCGMLDEGTALREYVELGLNIIKIGGPVLVIILLALDGIKAIASQNEDQMKKFYSHIRVRLICLLLLFFVPVIIDWLIDIVEIPIDCQQKF